VALPWHLHMYQVHGDKFVKTYFGYHLVERFSSEIEDKGAPWDFYLVVIRNTMRLWFIFLIPALVFFGYSIYKKELSKNSFILLIISIVTLLLFSSSSSKLKWYIMPIYPFLYIICGYFFYRVFNFLVTKKLNLHLISLSVYLFIFLNLGYFYTVRDMVYTYDFNFRSANILIINNSLPNIEKTYITNVDLPIALFYNEGKSLSFTQYEQLTNIIPEKLEDKSPISIITSPSNYKKLQNLTSELVLISENPDFVLLTLNYEKEE